MTGRRTPVILGLVALLLAFLSGYAVFTYLEQLTTLATVPVPRQSIPAGALISAALLQEREVPRSLLKEPIYTDAAELVGRVAQIPLQPGLVIYQSHACLARDYRLVDEPTLSVLSIPIDPSRAVGGQVQPGHKIDVWALPVLKSTDSPTDTLTATLILAAVRVVDVRSSQGQAVARQAQAVPGQYSGAAEQPGSSSQSAPLQILTLALPPSQTETLMAWQSAAQNGQATLWTALAPLVRPTPTQEETPPPTPTPTAVPTLTAPHPTVTPTPPRIITGVITGTAGLPLRVRAKPQTGAELGLLPPGTWVSTTVASTWTVDGTTWYYVTPLTATEIISAGGWVAGDYLLLTEGK